MGKVGWISPGEKGCSWSRRELRLECGMRFFLPVIFATASLAAVVLSWGQLGGAAAVGSIEGIDRDRFERGAALTNRCAVCHIPPDPSILPRRSWEIVLGDMGLLLGIEDKEYFEETPNFARVSERRRDVHAHFGTLPGPGLISEAEWRDLKYYYLSSAPEVPLPPTGKPAMKWDLDGFSVERPEGQLPGAFTTLVRIREETRQFYIGDSGRKMISLFDADGRRLGYPRKFRPEITPVDIVFDENIAYIASIGDVGGVDMIGRPAHIIKLDLSEDPYLDGDDFVVAKDLPRLADLELADLDGNGEMDLIGSGFGSLFGEIIIFPNPRAGSTEGKVILGQCSPVKTQAYDFNGDGLLDIAALLGNAREGLHILINRGGLEFQDHVVFQTHPGMGHTYFEIHDFNEDGLPDFLVVNGDNVDSDPYNTLKNFHGVRIYLNRGDLSFEQAYFYPMQGAFIARAADFDLDGDLDIAAVAFYPDFGSERPESFVYLENLGDLRFEPHSLPEFSEGRWMTMDAGDLDGDGDIDIVLGGVYVPIGMSRFKVEFEQLSKTGAPFLVLRNRAR